VEETGIDALGVAVGNVHILTEGKAVIDLEALERIRHRVKVPLVLHGGTGIPLGRVQDYIQRGVAKLNFGTTLKQVYLEAVRQKLAVYHRPMSPHPFVGMGGQEDIHTAGREAVKQKVKELVTLSGSAGKASQTSGRASTRTGGDSRTGQA
jgi:fructose/tagatose bisphosphate aldolase